MDAPNLKIWLSKTDKYNGETAGVSRLEANATRNRLRTAIYRELWKMATHEVKGGSDREAWEAAARIEAWGKQLREHIEEHGQ